VVSPDGLGTTMGPSSFRQVLHREWSDNPGDAAIYERDGAGWTTVPLPALEPPAVPGLRTYSRWFDGAAALGDGEWIAPALHFVEVPWGDADGSYPFTHVEGTAPVVDPWPMWNVGTKVLEIFAPGTISGPIASLTVDLVEGDPPTIEYRDAATNELIHRVPATLPGWTPEALLRALRGWGLIDVSFMVSHAGVVSVIRPPWPMDEEWSRSITTANGRYYTHTLTLGTDYSATAIHVWESLDGLAWKRVDLSQFTQELDYATLAGGPTGLVMVIHKIAAVREELWASTDGRDWVRSAAELSVIGEPMSTSFGWVTARSDRVAAISTDGRTWEALELPPLAFGEPGLQVVGDRLLLGPALVSDRYVTWVGRLVD
jgi:hypothetical protein